MTVCWKSGVNACLLSQRPLIIVSIITKKLRGFYGWRSQQGGGILPPQHLIYRTEGQNEIEDTGQEKPAKLKKRYACEMVKSWIPVKLSL